MFKCCYNLAGRNFRILVKCLDTKNSKIPTSQIVATFKDFHLFISNAKFDELLEANLSQKVAKSTFVTFSWKD